MTIPFISDTADRVFGSLRNRNFRVFFIGQAISQIGTWLQLIAQALLVLHLTDSGVALGLVTACQFAPVLLLGAWAGVVVDRVDKRRLMLITQTSMMSTAFVLGVLVIAGHVTVSWIYLLAALTGIANTFDNPARRVLVTELVSEAEMGNATSLASSLMTGARVIGPSIAAALIATVGIGWCFIANSASFLAVLIGLTRIDVHQLRPTERAIRAKGQVREGLRYVWQDEDLRLTVMMMAVVATFSYNWNVLLPLLAERTFHGNEGTYAFITTVFGIGSLCGSLTLARRGAVDPAFLVRSSVAFGLTSMVIAVAPNPLFAALAGAVAGGFGLSFLVGTATSLQLGSQPTMRGRVMALYTVLLFGSTPLGGPLMGWLAEVIGVRQAIGLGALGALGSGLFGFLVLRRRALRKPSPVIAEDTPR